ncbi:MAG: MiaB/RimO family radical SAM methylthiotransferase [Defluviitaleaceae bacterium]|nr:MiaB/RimO family radical SAM methylthiotransferase [Defluviitaleaceae bacterium]
MNLTIAVHTLGCKVNQCDADALISALKNLGCNAFSSRDFDSHADVFVINTCTVTHISEKKSRQMLRRAKKLNPNAFVAVCGCAVRAESSFFSEADFIFDARKPDDFFAALARFADCNVPEISSQTCTVAEKNEKNFVAEKNNLTSREKNFSEEKNSLLSREKNFVAEKNEKNFNEEKNNLTSREKNFAAEKNNLTSREKNFAAEKNEKNFAAEKNNLTSREKNFAAEKNEKIFFSHDVAQNKKTRAFIKIQDGCDRFCSYCIVPHVRGEIKSRPLPEIVSEAQNFVAAGALEIVLTGIQIAAYGNDTENRAVDVAREYRPENSLSCVIKKIAALDGVNRLRLSSVDPRAVDENFLEAVALPVVCEHFHLSLQSGCDATLKKMNRRYTSAEYAKSAAALRKIHADAALTTDIIVGFPGESDSDFLESLNFAREMKFAKLHVFEFSPRTGTPAAEFLGQVAHKIKSERAKIMRDLSDELQKNFLRAQIGKTLDVLFENENFGHSRNYCAVRTSHSHKKNTIQKIKINGSENEFLTGE